MLEPKVMLAGPIAIKILGSVDVDGWLLARQADAPLPQVLFLNRVTRRRSVLITRRVSGTVPAGWPEQLSCLTTYLSFQHARAEHESPPFRVASAHEIEEWDRYAEAADPAEFDSRVLTWGFAIDRDDLLGRYNERRSTFVALTKRYQWTAASTLVHADFHFDNCLVSPGRHTETAVVLDWDGAYQGCMGEGLDLVWAEFVEWGEDPAAALDRIYACRLRYGLESPETFRAVMLRGASRRLNRLIASMRIRGRHPARIGAYVIAWYSRYEFLLTCVPALPQDTRAFPNE